MSAHASFAVCWLLLQLLQAGGGGGAGGAGVFVAGVGVLAFPFFSF